MKIGRVVGTFVSGCFVYLAVACTGAVAGPNGAEGTPTPGGDAPTATGSSITRVVSPVPNAMADQWYTPGARLKLEYYAAADGATQFAGWYDSQRKEECSFTFGSDWQLHCMPAAGATMTVYFSDAQCSVALATSSSSPSAYAASVDGLRRYPVLQAHTGDVWAVTNHTCALASPGIHLFDVDSEVPADFFVHAVKKTAP